MHALWLSALLLSQAPASQDRTETFGLAFISAAEVEQALTGPSISVGQPRSRSLMPRGVHAWSIDARGNTITLSGEPEGIEAVKQIIRMLDVPPRHLSVEVRFIPLSTPPRTEGALYTALNDAEAEALTAKSSSRKWLLPTSNNHPVHFQAPMLGPGEPEVGQDITPRIGGDGTITVIVTAHIPPVSPIKKKGQDSLDDLDITAGSPIPQASNSSVVVGMRRLASGQATAIALPRQGVALWIRPTLLPEGKAPGK